MNTQLPLDLGDGLRLRWATAADTDALAEFNHRIHDEDPEINEIGAATREQMAETHPLVGPGNFTLVERTDTGEIVSSMNLISQTWSFGGVPFAMGRPELVGTDPAYRRRGLVRKQFEIIHSLSAARGEQMQAITGIPWYYRQFGYEMALPLGGGYDIDPGEFPKFTAEQRRYHLRPAQAEDIPFLQRCYAQGCGRQPFATQPSAAVWRYEVTERPSLLGDVNTWHLITTLEGEPAGYLAHAAVIIKNSLRLRQIELLPGHSWLDLLPSLVHDLWQIAQTLAAPSAAPTTLALRLGTRHPLCDVWPAGCTDPILPYAWYVRVPDLPAFLNQVRGGLQKHLDASLAAGFHGELKVHTYRSGWRIPFDHGQIGEITPWTPEDWWDGDARFPELTFLQLLCGRRRTRSLTIEHIDANANNQAQVLLDALFPAFNGTLWIIG
ncbi:MAG: GNAT family N-acetyltransferase [Caldilineales bacterium]|nr:GNAT family N-acetyltransferase [Caldilineales bacterium]